MSDQRSPLVSDPDPTSGTPQPAYAPELNATESVWSHLKRSLGNCAATNIDQLMAMVKTRLKRLQYRPDLLDRFLGQTGLVLQPVPP